jgi:glycosyltransferase involved in cell wall biosynthesis
MKLIFISNHYPPDTVGGYEMRCKQVARELFASHHVRVEVHTLSPAVGDSDIPVYSYPSRPAASRSRLVDRTRNVEWAHRCGALLHARLSADPPDLVVYWNMRGFPASLFFPPRQFGIPTVMWFEDAWLSLNGWGSSLLDAWYDAFARTQGKRIVRTANALARQLAQRESRWATGLDFTLPLNVNLGIFASQCQEWVNRSPVVRIEKARVMLPGVTASSRVIARSSDGTDLLLLYASTVTPDRGLDVIIEALTLLPVNVRRRVALTVAGDIPTPEARRFMDGCQERLDAAGWKDRVRLLGKVDSDQMQEVYAAHDVLIFPSARMEGVPLSIVEAMFAGCAVVASGSGGCGELCRDAAIPIFPANCPAYLAALIADLEADRARVMNEGERLKRIALERFTMRSTCGEIVREFRDLISSKK